MKYENELEQKALEDFDLAQTKRDLQRASRYAVLLFIFALLFATGAVTTFITFIAAPAAGLLTTIHETVKVAIGLGR